MANTGRIFENKLSRKLQSINRKGTGFFIKSPTPIKLIRNNDQVTPTFANKALCDFIGIYNNKFIIIEAKNISNERFNLSRLKKHQVNQLSAIKKFGGVSIIVFNDEENDEIIILDIDEYLDYVLNTELKSINLKKLREIGIVGIIKDLEFYISDFTI